MIPATPWEERERSIRELLSTTCVYMCVCVCLPVCAGAHVCIYEWKTEDKLSCCSRSTLAFVRQGLSQAWGLPNKLGWTANES